MIEKVEGIVINEKAYGETSKIINVITKRAARRTDAVSLSRNRTAFAAFDGFFSFPFESSG